MNHILPQPATLDQDFEYRVSLEEGKIDDALERRIYFALKGRNYVAGAKNCIIFSQVAKVYSIHGDVFADRVDTIESKVWDPKWTNPFATSTRTEERRGKEIYLPKMLIAHSFWRDLGNLSLTKFLQSLRRGMMDKYKMVTGPHESLLLFGEVHKHYISYLRSMQRK